MQCFRWHKFLLYETHSIFSIYSLHIVRLPTRRPIFYCPYGALYHSRKRQHHSYSYLFHSHVLLCRRRQDRSFSTAKFHRCSMAVHGRSMEKQYTLLLDKQERQIFLHSLCALLYRQYKRGYPYARPIQANRQAIRLVYL